jgi:hypothetical protein
MRKAPVLKRNARGIVIAACRIASARIVDVADRMQSQLTMIRTTALSGGTVFRGQSVGETGNQS